MRAAHLFPRSATPPVIERMLGESRSLLASILGQSPTSTLVVDAGGTAVWVNKAFLDLLGIRNEERIVGRYNILSDPQIREQGHIPDLRTVFDNAGATRFLIHCNSSGLMGFHIPGPDCAVIDVTAFPLAGDRGQVLGAVVQYADITEQKGTEEELRRAHQELELLLGSISSILICVNREGTITRWNAAAEETFGIPFSTAVGLPFSDCGIPWDLGDILDSVSEALKTGHTVRIDDIAFKRVDGSDGFLGITVSPVKGESEAPFGFILRGMDITAHKLADQALEERTRDLGNRLRELNFLYSMSTLVERPNLSLDEMLHAVLDLLPPAMRYRDEVCARITVPDQTLTTGSFRETPWKHTCNITLEGDHLGTVEVFCLTQKPDVDGSPFLKGERDLLSEAAARVGEVIGRRRAEEALREAQRRLLQSEKLASIGQLAAGVAHEINNPVGFVASNLGTLREYIRTFKRLLVMYSELGGAVRVSDRARQLDLISRTEELSEKEDLPFVLDDVEKLLGESKDGTDRIRDIVQNLKSFARIDEAELKEADINQGIEATLRIVWNELKYKCDIHKNLRDIPKIRCYPGQLNQVFMNLFVNAAQAIPDRGEISIESDLVDNEVIVRVSDTGQGIPPQDVSRIFDPFFTTKGIGGGTGLGLSISHGIVQKHHGRIDVKSELGEGTTFTVRLPIDGLRNE